MEKEKKFMIIGIFILLISLVGTAGTYAWFTWSSTNNTSLTMTIGKLADVIFTSGNNISTSTLAPVFNYTDGEKTSFSINNKDTTTFNYRILLNITSIDNELKNKTLKYKLVSNNTIITEGNFSNIENTNNLYEGELSKGNVEFIFYLYIDGNEDNDLNMINKSLVGTITVEEKTTLSKKITDLYTNAPKTTTSVNSVTYNLASSVGLMNDRKGSMSTNIDAGNIRYYGADPNNYIYFNCDSYPSTNCETWRIIGVFDGKVKIMRGSSLGNYSWDTSASSVHSGYGVNEWSQADLMKLLNPGHESESVGGSLYYNSKSGTCYNGRNNATISCNFTSTGIKNDTTRNMIADTTYNTGGHDTSEVFSNVMYEKERGITTVSNPRDDITRTTSWTGKIALAYPSDYGYATDLSKCSQTLYNYANSTCRSNDWFSSYNWLLTPYSNSASHAFNMYSTGCVNDYKKDSISVCNARGVVPVLSLTSELSIMSGTGESNSPYQLSVN